MNVTQKEFSLPDGLVIISTSDLQGNIVDYNAGFRDASGYADAELHGQPHSLLRHPDMPAAAFKDLWQTVSAGRPWFGIVKNRRKNGDHYWVQANVAPITEQGRITGYVSVRYPADRQQITQSEQVYAEINSNRRAFVSTKLERGQTGANIALSVLIFAALLDAIPMIGLLLGYELPIWAVTSSTVLSIIALSYFAYRFFVALRPTHTQQIAIEYLMNGAFKQPFDGHDAWTESLNLIRTRMGEAAARQYDHRRQSAILTAAMDTTSTNLMVADADFNIISINRSLEQMFARNERNIQQALPIFQANRVVGSNMAIFHRHPTQQYDLLRQLKGRSWVGEFQLAEITIRLTVTPIDHGNARLGYVVEWLERTQEVRLAHQVELIKQAAHEGVLHHRLELTHAEGIYRSLGEGVNELLEVLSSFSNVIAHAIGEIAFSRLHTEMQGDYRGAYRNTQNAINLSLRNLNELLGQVQFVSSAVTLSVQKLHQGVQSFSGQIQQQASAIEQTASAMTEMMSSVKNNGQHITTANHLTRAVHEQVEDSNTVMKSALDAMSEIHDSGSKISEIVSLIDAIAFQTNLLALNAAVEAARAGDHGRGFAVVAGEVRALAQKSANAAKDIKSLIDASVDQIARGTMLVERTSQSLMGVRRSIDEMSAVVSHISTASTEQETGIGEVNRAIHLMEKTAQQSATLVQTSADSAKQVSEQMQGLDAIVQSFALSASGKRIAQQGRSLLADMKQAHLNWRVRMSDVIFGNETIHQVDEVRNHQLCELGQWRNVQGQVLGGLPEIQHFDRIHEVFHQTVADAIALANVRDFDGANAKMREIEQQSNEIVASLDLIEARLQREGISAEVTAHRHDHRHDQRHSGY